MQLLFIHLFLYSPHAIFLSLLRSLATIFAFLFLYLEK